MSPYTPINYALKIEKKKKEFYGRNLKKIKIPKIIELFKFLLHAEEKHFQKLNELTQYFPLTQEIRVYLRALSHKKNPFPTDDVLEKAIYLEMDAYLLYHQLLKYSPPQIREILDKIKREEKEHLRKLILLREGK